MKALVTGGMGFIGTHLVKHLLSLGIEVLVLDNSIHKPTFHDISGATIIEGDVLSRSLLSSCLERVDTCFHLAALSSLPSCSRDWMFSHGNNVLAFNGLLEELRRLRNRVKLVYASSCAVYGDNESLPLSEASKVKPISTYGADKLSNEIYADVVHTIYGLSFIGLRLFNVYGPGQLASNPYSGVITAFKKAIRAKEALNIFGNGHQTRDFVYVQDVVEAFVAAARTPADKSGIFNVCSGRSISIRDLAGLMMRLSHHQTPINFQQPRPDDAMHSLGDGELAKKELHFTPKVSLEEGLSNYLKDNSFKA